jgi:hypothetical protein
VSITASKEPVEIIAAHRERLIREGFVEAYILKTPYKLYGQEIEDTCHSIP